MKPTNEQQIICQLPLVRGDLVAINAYAGTGKTTSLEMVSRTHYQKRILYVCFNRANAEEARHRFSSNTVVSTTHSLAFDEYGTKYAHKLGNLYIRGIADYLGVDRITAGAVKNILDRFLFNVGSIWSVPTYMNSRAEKLLGLAQQVWAAACDPKEARIPMPHDGYLKLWSLYAPLPNDYDVVLLDEAQDSNPIVMQFVQRMAAEKRAAVIMVGDIHQAIYGWRGAVDAMTAATGITHKAKLTTCFRFDQRIADYASAFLAQFKRDDVELHGAGGMKKDKSYAFLSRTNSTLVNHGRDLAKRNFRIHFASTQASQGYNPEEPYQFQRYRDILSLKRGRLADIKSPLLKKFTSFKELEEYTKRKHDEHEMSAQAIEGELSGAVALVNQMEEGMLTVLEDLKLASTDPVRSQITLSTAHRAKGMEWDNVMLADDYCEFYGYNADGIEDEEFNLLYVAITRTRGRLLLPEPYQAWFDRKCPQHASPY